MLVINLVREGIVRWNMKVLGVGSSVVTVDRVHGHYFPFFSMAPLQVGAELCRSWSMRMKCAGLVFA